MLEFTGNNKFEIVLLEHEYVEQLTTPSSKYYDSQVYYNSHNGDTHRPYLVYKSMYHTHKSGVEIYECCPLGSTLVKCNDYIQVLSSGEEYSSILVSKMIYAPKDVIGNASADFKEFSDFEKMVLTSNELRKPTKVKNRRAPKAMHLKDDILKVGQSLENLRLEVAQYNPRKVPTDHQMTKINKVKTLVSVENNNAFIDSFLEDQPNKSVANTAKP